MRTELEVCTGSVNMAGFLTTIEAYNNTMTVLSGLQDDRDNENGNIGVGLSSDEAGVGGVGLLRGGDYIGELAERAEGEAIKFGDKLEKVQG